MAIKKLVNGSKQWQLETGQKVDGSFLRYLESCTVTELQWNSKEDYIHVGIGSFSFVAVKVRDDDVIAET